MAKKSSAEKLLEKLGVENKEDFDNLLKELTKSFIEKSLNVEMDGHLGYKKRDQNSREFSNNYWKGKTKKTLNTKYGKLDVEIPRDVNSTFEPRLVRKHQVNLNDIEHNIIKLYSKGMSTREIQEVFIDLYGTKVHKV